MSGLQWLSRQIIDPALGIIFQTTCLACGAFSGGKPVCEVCEQLEPVAGHLCDHCGAVLSQPMQRCGKCFNRLRLLTRVRSLFWMRGGERRVLHRIKYGQRFELLQLFRQGFEAGFLPFFPSNVVVMPVPLHYQRWKERGFNQSMILAKWIAKKMGATCLDGLKKIAPTQAQSTLSRRARLRNLRGSFAWNSAVTCPSRVLLVDDVFTTGATLEACSRILRRAGVREVYGWTLFRTPERV